ncbi:hydroxyindole O-methyltransferase [Apiospora saccharicola]|uniref:Hydroxyindole O-methyltransferase n=1 Tax=Apiospora saccharicola TaxID=335842 RepID=A0ABR1UFG0_9PEZI
MSPHALVESSPMENLTRSLVRDVEALNDYIQSTGGVQPSFDRSCPTSVIPQDAPPEAQMARERIMDQCLKLLKLSTGPRYQYIACLQWLCHFDIFRLVPTKGAIHYSDLASRAGCTETRLKSVVRMAMTTGLFLEPTPQQVSHSATTRTRTAYNVAFRHDLPFFDRLGQNPELHRQFAGYMRALATNQGTHMKHLVKGLDWGRNPNATVVDVGGSTGHSCIALAQAYTNLRFIVQDLPGVVEGGPQILAGIEDTNVTRRIQYQSHNFFEPNPVVGADFYLLRLILHDWNADDCVRILRAILPPCETTPGLVLCLWTASCPPPGCGCYAAGGERFGVD